jgi:hypothetical protein
MPKRYGREFRRAICERLVVGERVFIISEGDRCLTCGPFICGSARP